MPFLVGIFGNFCKGKQNAVMNINKENIRKDEESGSRVQGVG